MRSISAFSLAALLLAAPAFAQSGYTGSAATSAGTATSAGIDARTYAQQASDAARRARASADQAMQAARSVNSPAADSAALAAQEAAAAAQSAALAAQQAAAMASGGSQTMSTTGVYAPQGNTGAGGRALGAPMPAPAAGVCPPGYVYEPGVPGRTIARLDECVPAGSATAKEVVPRPGSGVSGQSNNQIN